MLLRVNESEREHDANFWRNLRVEISKSENFLVDEMDDLSSKKIFSLSRKSKFFSVFTLTTMILTLDARIINFFCEREELEDKLEMVM